MRMRMMLAMIECDLQIYKLTQLDDHYYCPLDQVYQDRRQRKCRNYLLHYQLLVRNFPKTFRGEREEKSQFEDLSHFSNWSCLEEKTSETFSAFNSPEVFFSVIEKKHKLLTYAQLSPLADPPPSKVHLVKIEQEQLAAREHHQGKRGKKVLT